MPETAEAKTSPEATTSSNRGICSTCSKVVPARHVTRGQTVYLVKECPECGTTETEVSCDARRYQEKRDLTGYRGEAEKTCTLHCKTCTLHKPPTLVFLDVTNRCNMNCPICLANIPAMGFRFDPPMAYFERIFETLSQMDPKPKIQLFGGEPTCREDLVEMIKLARKKYGLQARVVTNGIRLADEDYCKELLATRCQLMFSFDGRDPSIYEATRKHSKAYEKKLKALENIRKHHKSKITLMVCVGQGVNDAFMGDLVEYCHEGRSFIAAMDLIPLTAHWGPEQIEVPGNTIEDVERIMAEQVPGVEFFPAAIMYRLTALRETFDLGRITFGGAHPNCETVSAMISDGTTYRPLSAYLTKPLNDIVKDALALDDRMGKELPKSLLVKMFGRKGRQLVYGWQLYRMARGCIAGKEILGPHPNGKVMRILWGLLRGVKMKHLLRAHTRAQSLMRLMILPFEEKECVEAARLVDCPAQFVYQHPETDEIRFMPVCAWTIYKNDILRQTADSYGVDRTSGDHGLTGLKKRTEVAEEETAASAS